MKSLVLFCVFLFALSTLANASSGRTDSSVTRSFWELFKRSFGRSYSSAQEEARRYQVFAENLHRIEELNREPHQTATFGVTQFADLTTEEFSSQVLSNVPDTPVAAANMIRSAGKSQTVPSSIDWVALGAVSSLVLNQGQCGSSAPYVAAAQTASMVYLKHKPQPLLDLSVQQISDCDSHGGCTGSPWPQQVYQYVVMYGLENSSAYHSPAPNTCGYNRSLVVASISAWQFVSNPAQKNETLVLDYVGTTGPAVACVNATAWQFYAGGVLTNCGSSDSGINHCAQITGYGTDSTSGTAYWRLKNTWGTSWGEAGFIRIGRGSNLCGISDMVTTVVAK